MNDFDNFDETPVVDTMNLEEVTVPEFIDKIVAALRNGFYAKPIVGLGPIGIGKTESVMRTLAELDVPYINDAGVLDTHHGVEVFQIRLLQYDKGEILGLPMVDEHRNTVRAVSKLLPPSDYKLPCVVFFDEITSCSEYMRTTLYQLLDISRGVDTYKFPKYALVVICGNGPQDGGDFRGIEAGLLTRGLSYRVKDDIELWLAWARKNGVHPAVISFLETNPRYMREKFDNELVMERDLVACPRTWVTLSQWLYIFEEGLKSQLQDPLTPHDELAIKIAICDENEGKNLSEEEFNSLFEEKLRAIEAARGNLVTFAFTDAHRSDLCQYVKGSVGVRIGEKFIDFYASSQYLPNVFDILNGKINAEQSLGIDKKSNLSANVRIIEIVSTLISSVVGQIIAETKNEIQNGNLPKDSYDLTMKVIPERLKVHLINTMKWIVGLATISPEYGAQAASALFKEYDYFQQLFLKKGEDGFNGEYFSLQRALLKLLSGGRRIL